MSEYIDFTGDSLGPLRKPELGLALTPIIPIALTVDDFFEVNEFSFEEHGKSLEDLARSDPFTAYQFLQDIIDYDESEELEFYEEGPENSVSDHAPYDTTEMMPNILTEPLEIRISLIDENEDTKLLKPYLSFVVEPASLA